jgi:hypothetical protein
MIVVASHTCSLNKAEKKAEKKTQVVPLAQEYI